MYSSGYSQVSKYSPQAQKKMQYRTKSKGCGYYMRIVFFFSSLIQSLIIVSLVLFLVYGKKQDSAATDRIQDLEESFSSLSLENVELRKQRKNLTTFLNATLIEKARNDWDLARIRHISNISSIIIEEINRQQQQCQAELSLCRGASRFNSPCSPPRTFSHGCDCGIQVERLVGRLEVVESNFSRTAERMRMETDLIARDRDNINLEAIRLRRDKAALERELQHYRQRCKEDFRLSLSGIGNVSKAFLQKIETLFPTHLSFQLTCEKQQEHLEQIRSNCTNLSRDVEDKFQRYLNNVGDQVSNIQRENSRLKTENGLLNEDYRKCSQNRTGMMREHSAYVSQLQLKHDKDTERHLMEKIKLSGDLEVLNKSIKLKNKEFEHLSDQVRQLNSTCIFRQPFQGGSTNRFNSAWNLNNEGSRGGSNGFGAAGPPFNKPVTGGLGSTGYGSTGVNTGIGGGGSPYNRPATGGSTNYGSAGSNTGYGAGGSQYNKPATGGYGSTGLNTGVGAGSTYNKPASGGYGSTGSNTGVGAGVSTYNKPATGGYGSTGSNTGTGAGGSQYNKPAAGGYGSTGSNTGTGAGASTYNKPATGGYGSTGSNTGVGAGASTYNKPATGGYGSTGSNTGQGAGASTYNKPATGGLGSSSYGSTGSGINKVATSATGSSTGSTSSGINKQGTSATGSSSSGSTGSSSGGASAVKPVTNSRGTSTQGQTPGSAGSTGSAGTGVNKPASSGSSASTGKSLSSWWSFGASSNTQNKPGSTAGKGTSSGSPVGTGRTSGLGGGSINVAQHLLDLKRIANPSAPEERQDLSRMLG